MMDDKWQPIETAPFVLSSPSGRPEDADQWLEWCLLWVPDPYGGLAIVGGMDAGIWLHRDDNRACGEFETKPTHWMPLPDPPHDT